MKKILTILTVALLACTTVFAALNVSGEFEAEVVSSKLVTSLVLKMALQQNRRMPKKVK